MKIKISAQKYNESNTLLVLSYITRYLGDFLGFNHKALQYSPLAVHTYDLANNLYDRFSKKKSFIEVSSFLKETNISGKKEYVLKTTEVYDSFITIGLIQSILGIASELIPLIPTKHADKMLQTLHLKNMTSESLTSNLKLSTYAAIGLNMVFGSNERTIIASYGVKPLKMHDHYTENELVEESSLASEELQETIPLMEGIE